MADNNLQIGATVDVGQLQSGMSTSVDAIKAATDNIGISFQECSTKSRAAMRGISDEVKANAESVGAASVQIAQATRQQVQAQLDVRRALVLVKDADIDTAASTAILAAAQERARAAAASLAEAQEGVARSSEHVVPEMAASSAAIRSLEGAVPIRAIERFVGTTLGLGPILTAAFPVIGAVDLGIAAIEAGEKVYSIGDKAMHAGQLAQEAFEGYNAKIQITNDDLAIQNDKLQDEIDKLSGHPNNGLVTALDEARKMADQLLDSLRDDRKELQALLKENDVSVFGSILTGIATLGQAQAAPTGKQDKEMLADQRALTSNVAKANEDFAAATENDRSPEAMKAAGDKRAAAIRSAFETQISAYTVEAARLKQEEASSKADAVAAASTRSFGGAGATSSTIDNSDRISNVEGRLQTLKERLQREITTESIATRTATVGVMKQAAAEGKEDSKAAQEAMRAAEEGFAERQHIRPLSAGEAASYWASFLDEFQRGSEQYKKVLEEVNRYTEENHRQMFSELMKTDPSAALRDASGPQERMQAQKAVAEQGAEAQKVLAEALKESSEMARKAGQDVTESGKGWEEYWKSVAKGGEISENIKIQLEEARVRAAAAAGALTPLAAAQENARIHAEQHAAALRILEAELARVNAEIAKSPGMGGVPTPQQATERQGIQNAISQQKGQAGVQGLTDQAAQAQAMATPYQKAFQTIGNDWNSTVEGIIRGQTTLGRGFEQMGGKLILSLVSNLDQMAVKWAQHEALTVAQHQVANTTKVASDTVAAAQSNTISATSTLQQGIHYAVLAAQKAFSAFADIPLVGPELGAVAAGATFTAVLALNTFAQGGVVSGQYGAPQVIQAHAGERVLSQTQTNMFHAMLDGGPRGNTNHYHLGGNSFSSADGDFQSQFSQHESHVITSIKGWQRDGKL